MGYSVQSLGQTGTWIPTWTGFSVDPSNVTARYTLIGKLCTVHLHTATGGTSNTTAMTFTLPFTAANTVVQVFSTVVINNGTAQAGRIQTRANSNIADAYATPGAGAWTASGGKGLFMSSYTYEIA